MIRQAIPSVLHATLALAIVWTVGDSCGAGVPPAQTSPVHRAGMAARLAPPVQFDCYRGVLYNGLIRRPRTFRKEDGLELLSGKSPYIQLWG